ncbi:MAG: hypothetical protein ACWA5L_04470 [bacterium]
MSKIESSIRDLSIALEELSAQAERQLFDHEDRKELLATTQRRAKTAQTQANEVALELATIIADLKQLHNRIDAAE